MCRNPSNVTELPLYVESRSKFLHDQSAEGGARSHQTIAPLNLDCSFFHILSVAAVNPLSHSPGSPLRSLPVTSGVFLHPVPARPPHVVSSSLYLFPQTGPATTIFAADEDIQEGQLVVFFLLHRKVNVREDGVELFFECQHLIPFDDDEGIIHIPSPKFRSVVSENQRLQPL
ncbi:hypothetical protein SprV_0100134200 [Sparganum proliferum]